MQWSISASMQIPTKGGTNPTYRFLDNLEKMAAGFITLYVNGRFLEQQNTMHTFRPSKAVSGTHSSALRIPDLYIRFPSLIKDAPWSIGVLSLSFQGLTSDDGSCTVIVVGRTKEPMTQLSSTDVSGEDMDVAFHPQSGSYAIRFTVKVGMPVIAQLVEKLYRIQRLIRFISIIRSFKLNCMHVTLGSVCFRYSDTPELSAEIGFTGEGNEEMKLILPKGSPHIRIQQLLQNHLNNVGLETVIKALHATLPLLLALDKVEATIPPAAEDDLIIIARGIDWFRLDYRSKNYVLDARLKHRRSVLYWYICDPLATPGPPTTRAVCEAVKRIWGEEGPGWQGLKTGVAVELSAVQEVIKIIHETVSSAPPGVIPAAAQPQQQPPQQQQQQIQLQAPPPPMAAHTPQQIHTPQQQMHTPKQTHTPLQQMHTPKQAHTPLQQMHTPQSSQPPHQQLHHTPQPAHQQLHLTSQSAQQLQLTPQSAQQLQHTPQTPHQQLQQTPQPQQLQNTQTPTGPTSQLAHLQHMQHQRMQALGRGAGGINGNGTGPPAPLGR